ncbi:hypothetical protein C4D60_Mb05t16810 [Musa balbisiana]|uniref:Cytochrome c domain-containing protein n=1 Tax=Musa balbisiana TaxID=52838 RepID=A0A4S8JWN9_MUSBA|nr:hypothetical protein C4D60_Mb05t16810 [Musa balbisiana]
MAAGRITSQLLRKRHHIQSCAPILVPSFAFNAYQGNVESALMKSVRVLAVMGAGVISFATVASADEAEHGTACPTYPWPHKGILDSYDHDHASIRRGQQVYQQSCASCHSFSLFSYRNLVGVVYAEEERKGVTADIEVVDGPNEEGEAFACPGKLCDPFRRSHHIERAAKTCNSDLSFIKMARHNGQNYIFSLLAGIRHPTAGVMKEKGKDVVTFLSWATEPEMFKNRMAISFNVQMGFKWIFVLSLLLFQAACYRRLNGSVLKSRKTALNGVG